MMQTLQLSWCVRLFTGTMMTQRMRRAIAIYEIVAFVAVAINVGIVVAVSSAGISLPGWMFLAAIFTLSFGSLVAGILLWRDRPPARNLSIGIQALQVPRIAVEGIVTYGVQLAFEFGVHIGTAPPSMRGPVYLAMDLGQGAEGTYFGVNVLAFAALVILARWRQIRPAATQSHAQTA